MTMKHAKVMLYVTHRPYWSELECINLDVAKAYDSVEHWSILQTMRAYGFAEKDARVIMTMIENTTTRLTTAYGLTEEIKVTRGVRQGDIISPSLYVLFLNPLLSWLKEGGNGYSIGTDIFDIGAYADDMTLMSESGHGIRNMMEKVNVFMDHNNVLINEDKSTYHWINDDSTLLETRGRKLRVEGDLGLFTYLGWTTNLRLDWTEQIESLMTKYIQGLHFVMQEKNLTINQRVKLINSMLHPIITYRTRLMYIDDNTWLESLDKLTVRMLNRRGGLDRNINMAYWHRFRGLNSIKIEADAGFIGFSVD